MTEPKQATSRQRSAFSDALEITQELSRLGIPPEEMTVAMEYSLEEFGISANYMTQVHYAKWMKEKGKEETE